MTGLENWDLINQAYGEACSSTTLSPTAHKHTVANQHKNLSPSCFQTNFIVLVKTKARTSPYKDISVFSCTHASDRLQPSCLLPSRLPSSLHVWDMVMPDCVGMRSRRDYVCAQSLITSFRIDYYSSGLQSQRVTVEASKTLSCTAWRCHSVYMCVWVNVVKWSQACLLQSDRHFFPLPLSCSFFSFLFFGGGRPSILLPVSPCPPCVHAAHAEARGCTELCDAGYRDIKIPEWPQNKIHFRQGSSAEKSYTFVVFRMYNLCVRAPVKSTQKLS